MEEQGVQPEDVEDAIATYEKYYRALKLWKERNPSADLDDLKSRVMEARIGSEECRDVISILDHCREIGRTSELTTKSMSMIARHLPEQELHSILSEVLNIEECDLNLDIPTSANRNSSTLYQFLLQWKEKNGDNATETALRDRLQEGVKVNLIDQSFLDVYDLLCQEEQ